MTIELIRRWNACQASVLKFFFIIAPVSWKKWRLISAVEVKRKVSPSVVRGCASFLSATCSAEKSALFTFVLAILHMFSFLSCCGCAVEKMLCMQPVRQPIIGQVI